MPAVYAHNLFGKEVKTLLNPDLEKLLDQNIDLYNLGLQGPDYLFFYKPFSKNAINRLGYEIHEQPARTFLEQALPVIREKGSNSPEYAYLLGFFCHFMLDSECHPYVESMVKELSFDHIEMESEFEKFLMIQEGLDPFKYPLYHLIPKGNFTAPHVLPLYESYGVLSLETVTKAIDSTKLFKKLLYTPGPFKQEFIKLILRLSGHYDSFQGQLLHKKQNSKSYETNPALHQLFNEAVPKTVALIEDFHENPKYDATIDKQFDRNFE